MKIPTCSECPATKIGCGCSNGNHHVGNSACKIFHKEMQEFVINNVVKNELKTLADNIHACISSEETKCTIIKNIEQKMSAIICKKL